MLRNCHFTTIQKETKKIYSIVPHLQPGLTEEKSFDYQQELFDDFMKVKNPAEYMFWYYTPVAYRYSAHYRPVKIIYDCLYDCTGFKYMPEEIAEYEDRLVQHADDIYTSSDTSFISRTGKHDNLYLLEKYIDCIALVQKTRRKETCKVA